MKQYKTPKVTGGASEERSFVVPAVAGIVAGVIAMRALNKTLDAIFDRSIPYNVNKLEPVMA